MVEEKEDMKMLWVKGDAHKLIKQKQIDIWKETGKDISIQDIATQSVLKGIDLVKIEDIQT